MTEVLHGSELVEIRSNTDVLRVNEKIVRDTETELIQNTPNVRGSHPIRATRLRRRSVLEVRAKRKVRLMNGQIKRMAKHTLGDQKRSF